MKILSFILGLLSLLIRSSCTSNDEPTPPVFMLPSSIDSNYASGEHQSFSYDEYGRIVDWALTYNHEAIYTARYSYPDDNTILVNAKEILGDNERSLEETIQLINGRALKSEGTFVSMYKGYMELQKTYQLEFEYDPSNHLTVVKHLEVVGIGDDIKDSEWEKPWTWENYLIWEDGNLKEFQDYGGSSDIMKTTKFEYLDGVADYPIIIPFVINSAHHLPLFMQEIFGLNSKNLVSIISEYDYAFKTNLQTQYTYEFDQSRVIGYVETHNFNTSHPVPISYKVYWTER